QADANLTMLAIIYLALTFWLGDVICRRFYRFTSAPHRLAGAFLIGLLASTWFTYLSARIFAATMRPLMWGNLLFLIAVISIFAWTRRKQNSPAASAQELALASANGPFSATADTPVASVAELEAPSVVADDGEPVAEMEKTESGRVRDEYPLRPPGS